MASGSGQTGLEDEAHGAIYELPGRETLDSTSGPSDNLPANASNIGDTTTPSELRPPQIANDDSSVKAKRIKSVLSEAIVHDSGWVGLRFSLLRLESILSCLALGFGIGFQALSDHWAKASTKKKEECIAVRQERELLAVAPEREG